MTDIDLDAALALCDAADHGKWEASETGRSLIIDGVYRSVGRRENAEFIAAARTLVPELIAELRDARTEFIRMENAWRVECDNIRYGNNDDDRAERDALQARLDDVLAEHQENGHGWCQGCPYVPGIGYTAPYPCPTRRAATGDA